MSATPRPAMCESPARLNRIGTCYQNTVGSWIPSGNSFNSGTEKESVPMTLFRQDHHRLAPILATATNFSECCSGTPGNSPLHRCGMMATPDRTTWSMQKSERTG